MTRPAMTPPSVEELCIGFLWDGGGGLEMVRMPGGWAGAGDAICGNAARECYGSLFAAAWFYDYEFRVEYTAGSTELR
jgi:hypothetical protein